MGARGRINATGWINVLIKQSSHSPAPQPAQPELFVWSDVTEEEDAEGTWGGGEEEFGWIDNVLRGLVA